MDVKQVAMAGLVESNRNDRNWMNVVLFLVLVTVSACMASCGNKEAGKPTDNERDDEAGIEKRIFDNAYILTSQQEKDIYESIRRLEQILGPQLAIVTIDHLNGEGINEFSNATFERLRLGRDKFKDGLLITVVVKERTMRIDVGYGLEMIIKDEIAARIIREDLVPRFRKKEYAKGLETAIDKLTTLIEDHRELVGRRMK